MIKAIVFLCMAFLTVVGGYVAANKLNTARTAQTFDRAKESVGGRLPFVVLAVSGTVQYQPLGSTEWRTVKKGELILAGAKIQVREGTLSMRSGRMANVTMGNNTLVTIRDARRRSDGRLTAAFQLHHGEVVASVSKHFSGDDFVVETANGAYSATSSVFAVASLSGVDTVVVKDGTVRSLAGSSPGRQFTSVDGFVSVTSEGAVKTGVAGAEGLGKLIVDHAQTVASSAALPEMDRPFVLEQEQERLRSLVVSSASALKAGDIMSALSVLAPTLQVNGQTLTAGQAAEVISEFLSVHAAGQSEIGAAGVSVSIETVPTTESASAVSAQPVAVAGTTPTSPTAGATDAIVTTAAPAGAETTTGTTTTDTAAAGTTTAPATEGTMTAAVSTTSLSGTVTAEATTLLTGSLVATESIIQDQQEVLTCEIYAKPVVRMKWVLVNGEWKVVSVIINY